MTSIDVAVLIPCFFFHGLLYIFRYAVLNFMLIPPNGTVFINILRTGYTVLFVKRIQYHTVC